jgi:hypothetical protein
VPLLASESCKFQLRMTDTLTLGNENRFVSFYAFIFIVDIIDFGTLREEDISENHWTCQFCLLLVITVYGTFFKRLRRVLIVTCYYILFSVSAIVWNGSTFVLQQPNS